MFSSQQMAKIVCPPFIKTVKNAVELGLKRHWFNLEFQNVPLSIVFAPECWPSYGSILRLWATHDQCSACGDTFISD